MPRFCNMGSRSTIPFMDRALALLLAFSSIPAAAQSFSCKLAQSPREHATCSSPKLSKLDSEVAAAYKNLRAQLSPEGAAAVQSDQREWLRWLDLVCPANGKGPAADLAGCLEAAYNTRKEELRNTKRIDGVLLFTRANFAYAPAKPGEEIDSSSDPGFGYGTFQWPQIDRPNSAQTAWNAAIKTRALALVTGSDSRRRSVSFDTAVDATGTVDTYFTLTALNDRLIDVALIVSTYGFGAAHPLTGQHSFLWWLDRNRELTTDDVFLKNSGWQQHLVPLAIGHLNANPDLKDMLWKGDELQKAVQSGIANPAAWTLTREGLTITFGQYAVAPYAVGMPEAHISWGELKPFLEPSLQPGTLPTALPAN